MDSNRTPEQNRRDQITRSNLSESDDDLYGACMRDRGYIVFKDGDIYFPTRPYDPRALVGTPPLAYRPPEKNPPSRETTPPEQPLQSASSIPTTSEPSRENTLTFAPNSSPASHSAIGSSISGANEITPEQLNILKILKTASTDALGECLIDKALDVIVREHSHSFFCFMGHFGINLYKEHLHWEDVRHAICGNPDIMLRIQGFTPRVEQAIVSKINCALAEISISVD